MEQRLSLVTLGVRDLARARKFYEEGLGWSRNGGVEAEVAFYQLGGMILALWGRDSLAADGRLTLAAIEPGQSFGGLALAYNTRSEAEVDAVLAEAAAAGGLVLKPAEKTDWGGYAGYFADPDGHPWEVAWNPFWTLRDDGRVSLEAPA
ncbi:VOC family protein [Pelagibius sp. 7325]|uniref:VOC family protein n=1 Tax=Pelagibius sp. 7325 TaxID=3131994 RepID=UPI0030ED9E9E